MRNWLSRDRTPRRTQAQLAVLAELTPANVTRWLSQQNKPDQEAIERIVAKLDRPEGLALALAWLQDHVPAAMRQQIEIRTNPRPVMVEEEAAFPEGMGEELKERLIFFGRLAMGNPDIRQILDVCYEAASRGKGLAAKKAAAARREEAEARK